MLCPSHQEAQARRGGQSCATTLLLGFMHTLPAPSTGWELAQLLAAETEAHRAWSHSSHRSALSLLPVLVGAIGIGAGLILQPFPCPEPAPICHHKPVTTLRAAERCRHKRKHINPQSDLNPSEG